MSPVKSPEQSNVPDIPKKDKIVVEKDVADELPPGWIMEVKIRKKRKTGSATKIDRLYTDPVTGYIFRSLKAAQRYVKTGKLGTDVIKPKNNGDERLHMKERAERSESKVQMNETMRRKRHLDKTISEFSETGKSELFHSASKRLAAPSPPPPEPITRQATRLAGIKADTPSRLLTEPKTRQATRLAGVAVDAPPPTPSPLEYKIRQNRHLAELPVDAPPPSSPSPPEIKTGQTTRLAEMTVDSSLPSPSPIEPKTRKAILKAGIEIDSPPRLPPGTRTTRLATRQAGTKIDPLVESPPAPKTYQAAQQSGTKIDSPTPSLQEPKTRSAERVSGVRDKASLSQPVTRRITRQAGIKIDSPPPSPPDTRNTRQGTKAKQVKLATPKANHKTTENADMDNNPNHNQETSSIIPRVNPENTVNQAPPTALVPPVNFGKQKSPMVNPTVNNPIPQDRHGYRGDSSNNFSMNNLWTDPCIEFAVKTLTGAIPCGDLNKLENPSPSPLKVPIEELWTDPCIEFAVKTLTGAIPVGEDDHLQHRPVTSRNTRGPHDSYLPDTGMRRFETGQNKQQQDSTFGNSSLQKSGNVVNGPCS